MEHDNLLFQMPPTLTVQEVADYLRVSPGKIYEMCRAHYGKFFPHFKVGNRFKIPRDKFIEWLDSGGVDCYQQQIAAEETKRQNRGIKSHNAESIGRTLEKKQNPELKKEKSLTENRLELRKNLY